MILTPNLNCSPLKTLPFATLSGCCLYSLSSHVRPNKTCTCKVLLTMMSQTWLQKAYGLVEALTGFLVAC